MNILAWAMVCCALVAGAVVLALHDCCGLAFFMLLFIPSFKSKGEP